MSALEHAKVFLEAWQDPAATRYERAPLDVNAVLAERYDLATPLVLTRTMIWDMEVRKARRPDLFIPYVVAAGSADAWGTDDVFVRRSRQRLWLRPDTRGLILEQTNLDHANQIVTFIGTGEHPGPDGEPLRATTEQPIFHVEHSVGGTEERPVDRWRIVHLTTAPDEALTTLFARIDSDPWLPEYVEIYVRDVLGVPLSRRSS